MCEISSTAASHRLRFDFGSDFGLESEFPGDGGRVASEPAEYERRARRAGSSSGGSPASVGSAVHGARTRHRPFERRAAGTPPGAGPSTRSRDVRPEGRRDAPSRDGRRRGLPPPRRRPVSGPVRLSAGMPRSGRCLFRDGPIRRSDERASGSARRRNTASARVDRTRARETDELPRLGRSRASDARAIASSSEER